MVQPKTGAQTDLIIGRNSVMEALRAGRAIDSLLVARGDRSGSISRILAECREKGIVIKAGRAIIKVLPPMLPLMPMLAWRSS